MVVSSDTVNRVRTKSLKIKIKNIQDIFLGEKQYTSQVQNIIKTSAVDGLKLGSIELRSRTFNGTPVPK